MKKIILLIVLLSMIINTHAIDTSTIVMDIDSGRILYENNAYEKRLIASTTKIMTFIVAYEYGSDFLKVQVEAGEEILKMYGTSIYLNYKETMSLKDLLYGLMLRSGNDASVVIANFIAGSEDNFVELMNDKASKLGMHNTVFNNPHGLDEVTKNYSTAYDMALLSIYANKNSFYKEVTSTKYYKTTTANKAYSWINRNKLLFSYPYLVSGKTGYTPSAGKTFVSSASKDNFNVTIVTLNDNNTYENHRMLYEEVFSTYKKKVILRKNSFRLPNIKYKDAYIKNDLEYPLKDGEMSNIVNKSIIYDEAKDGIIGHIEVYLNNEKIDQVNIFGANNSENKEERGVWGSIKSFFEKFRF